MHYEFTAIRVYSNALRVNSIAPRVYSATLKVYSNKPRVYSSVPRVNIALPRVYSQARMQPGENACSAMRGLFSGVREPSIISGKVTLLFEMKPLF